MSIGKLHLEQQFPSLISEQLVRNQIDLLTVTTEHVMQVATLALHHRDPFDRMLVAQAMVERIPILSADHAFDTYPIQRLW